MSEILSTPTSTTPQENNKTSGKVKEGRVHRLRPSILDPKYREKVKDLFTEGQDLKRSMEEYLTKVERVIGCSADDMEWDMTNVKIIMRDADLKGNSSTRVFMSETGGRSPDEKPEGRNGGRNAPNEAKVQSATTMKMDEE
ncbi:hypothetical protein MMC25_004830 [Agyrium rufum]|nr:hypothetical protein [Agyrium rufum]